jgi:hypothetical protein
MTQTREISMLASDVSAHAAERTKTLALFSAGRSPLQFDGSSLFRHTPTI